jgi:hypothetical protein
MMPPAFRLWRSHPARNLLHQPARERELGRPGQLGAAPLVNEQQRVVVLPKSIGADVADQQRHFFAQAFGLCVFSQVMAFRGKAHAKQLSRLGGGQLGDGGQDVGVLGKRQLRGLARAVFFDFLG